jgi:hypothetical protein
MRTVPSLFFVLSVFLAGRVSHADAEETRLGIAGVAFLVVRVRGRSSR